MGPWHLDDDTALDWLGEITESEDRVAFLRQSIADPTADGYLEFDDCVATLATAEIVAAALNGPRTGLPDDALELLKGLDVSDVQQLAESAAKGAARVLMAGSELNELWSENAEDYPRWKNGVEELVQKLAG